MADKEDRKRKSSQNRARAAQLAALHQAILDKNLPAVQQLLEDDPDLPSQANVRAKNAGTFSLQTLYICMHISIYTSYSYKFASHVCMHMFVLKLSVIDTHMCT